MAHAKCLPAIPHHQYISAAEQAVRERYPDISLLNDQQRLEAFRTSIYLVRSTLAPEFFGRNDIVAAIARRTNVPHASARGSTFYDRFPSLKSTVKAFSREVPVSRFAAVESLINRIDRFTPDATNLDRVKLVSHICQTLDIAIGYDCSPQNPGVDAFLTYKNRRVSNLILTPNDPTQHLAGWKSPYQTLWPQQAFPQVPTKTPPNH